MISIYFSMYICIMYYDMFVLRKKMLDAVDTKDHSASAVEAKASSGRVGDLQGLPHATGTDWLEVPTISGWWFQSPWKIWKSVGMIIPNIWENNKCSKPPTRYLRPAVISGNIPTTYGQKYGTNTYQPILGSWNSHWYSGYLKDL